MHQLGFWKILWGHFRSHKLGIYAFWVVIGFFLMAVYAPFLASSKPLVVYFDGQLYFPLFRYLFYPGFFTKRLDLFFNLLIFTLPLGVLLWKGLKKHPKIQLTSLIALCFIQGILFVYISIYGMKDPSKDLSLIQMRKASIEKHLPLSWQTDLSFMTPYEKLNLVINAHTKENYHRSLERYAESYNKEAQKKWLDNAIYEEKRELLKKGTPYQSLPSEEDLAKKILSQQGRVPTFTLPTLWELDQQLYQRSLARQKELSPHEGISANVKYLIDRHTWIEQEKKKISLLIMPLIRPFHWEEDSGGEQSLNAYVPWWHLSRITHKDLTAALIFGTRISLTVGLLAVGLSFCIGIPIGALSGYYGGTLDIVVSRILEIWEAMPTFFMLLLVVAITESKSIFLVISVIGLFGWTSFSRYIRGEFFKQRHLLYVEACHSLGYKDRHIIFSHILPNAIPPVLTLLPFAIMGAITSEAGLSFLGLGEEGSCSWGVLMDEGRVAFPAESYLLWPPAILLTILLIAIALVGDALRDVIDPRSYASQGLRETPPST